MNTNTEYKTVFDDDCKALRDNRADIVDAARSEWDARIAAERKRLRPNAKSKKPIQMEHEIGRAHV